MYKGGRKKDPIWEYFDEIPIANGKIAAKCKKCGHVQSNKAMRMRSHVSTCVKTKSDEYVEIPSSSSSTCVTKEISSGNSQCKEDAAEPPQKKSCLDNNISKYVCKTSTGNKQNIDLMVAKLFYACNIPFAVVESGAFKNLIHALRPGYRPPSRKELAGDLLDAIHNEMEEAVKLNLQGKEGTLVIDGWSNIHNEPITASLVQVDSIPYIVDIEATGARKKTAEFLTEKCNDVISSVQTKYNCKIKSIVTDNAKNMEKMRNELSQQDQSSTFISYGCAAHWLNLLGEDITPSSVLKHVVEVNKYFRNHHAPASWLKECSDHVAPQLPGNTRWNSQLICLETFIRNHSCYIKIANEHFEDMDQNIVTRIRDFNLYRQVSDLSKQLKPISNALSIAQSDSTVLADACHIWCSLLKNEDLEPHFSKIKKRFDQAILPCHFAAYLLHPKHRGEHLNYAQKENAKAWLGKINPDYLPCIINFELKEQPFPKTYFSDYVINSISASKWWKSIAKSSEISEDFCMLVAHLQVCPASSAAIERIFSNFSFIHSKTRNRLSTENASKLVFCYAMLRQKLGTVIEDVVEIDEN